MAKRKRAAPPVDIALTEEELASILRETRGSLAAVAAAPVESAPVASAPPLPAPVASPAPVPYPEWSVGPVAPGAVGDAIRMILAATTLDRGRRSPLPGGE